MKWSWRLGTIRGIDIKVHITFGLILLWGAFAWGSGGLGGAAYGVFLTLTVFAVVLLHELGHALAAQRYGIRVQDIVLLPIGGLARLNRMPDKPVQELVVALAGPTVNLGLLILLAPLVALGVARQAVSGVVVGLPNVGQPGLLNFVAFLFSVNLTLLLFNMLPAFPLDGGRVLRALLALRLPYARATEVAAVVGRSFAILFGFLAFLSGNISLGLIAFFVFAGAGAESMEVAVRESLRGLRVADAVNSEAPMLSADAPAYLAFERLLRSPYPAFAVMDAGDRFLGMVTRAGMQRAWAAGVRGEVRNFVEEPLLVVRGDASLEAARHDMARAGVSVVAVFIEGCFAGLLDTDTIRRVTVLQRLRPVTLSA